MTAPNPVADLRELAKRKRAEAQTLDIEVATLWRQEQAIMAAIEAINQRRRSLRLELQDLRRVERTVRRG